ncbi:hypothetical protein WJX81_006284 [Elliptochloris bilobata]|uniref:Peptidase M50 domain-containing protein n=1 Tax=Elliptochloris bilobata TaxID=381761 RepID=A0AAW1QX91_9CHLO
MARSTGSRCSCAFGSKRPSAQLCPAWAFQGRHRLPEHSRLQSRHWADSSRRIQRAQSQSNEEGGPADSGLSSSEAVPDGVSVYDSTEFDAGNITERLPREVVRQMRDTVFGFEFFVTGVEDYQANGVLFKGNLRGDPARAYRHISERLQAELGGAWVLYLLDGPEEGRPVAVVLPAGAGVEGSQPLPTLQEAYLAAVFCLATLITTLNANGLPLLEFDSERYRANLTAAAALAALPGTAIFFTLLLAHEAGHRWAALRRDVQLGPPIFVPAWLGFLGSFGAITTFRRVLPDRETLLEVAAAGPAAGAAASLVAVAVGLALSANGSGGIQFEPGAFDDSLLIGVLGRLVLGDRLLAESVNLSPVLIAGWAGLIVNALNCLPTGVLDGGRIAHGLWGRRAAGRVGVVTLLLLGLGGLVNTLALFWALLVVTLQRGPVPPVAQEIAAPPSKAARRLGVALLVLPLLVLLPLPLPVAPDVL